MKIQILIPHYKETLEEIKPLLNSLAIQQAIDFKDVGVIIADDGPKAKKLKINESDYPFEIKQIKNSRHAGVSACRNLAFDAATADYVMFCDADDMFCDVCGLYVIFNEIANGGFDALISCFREENRNPLDKSKPLYINRDMDSTFVHGKVYKRKYLLDNQIKFNPKLTIHEDSFFNILAQNLTENAKYCPQPFYLWKWRDASVCRHDPDYILKTYNNMIDSNDALIDEFIKRMRNDKANFFVGFMVMDAYYLLNKPEWMEKTNSSYREAVEKRFADYWKKHKEQFNKLTNEEKMQISTGVRTRSVQEGMLMEAITLEQWLNKIENKNQE